MKNLKLLSLALILISTQAKAVIINVPAQYNTIQSAINVSNNSDTILVQPGTYFENINFRGKSIVLTSKYYLNSDYSFIESTIINGSNPVYPDSASCVVMGNHEDSNTVLQGFTLTGGTGTKWLDIHNGFYYTEGGGIIMEFASPTIRNNIIRDNEAINISNGSKSSGGGAIRCGDSNPKILNNLIINNRGRYGAGIVFNYSAGLVKNNVILKNYGGEDYGGAGIWMVGTNSATVVTIENNTIVQNRSVGPNARGGADQVFSIRAVIINNIVWGNTQTIRLQINTSGGGIVNATYNNVQGGFTGAGNIDINPLFDSTNFYLNNNSPCIDKGDSSIIYNDPSDQNNP
ncbi:MAG TPA: hypothetical protein PKD83_10010, partial [Ignavibacteria bacterium]|nr:hypothetical protein [Ignavibacteria bacterium]